MALPFFFKYFHHPTEKPDQPAFAIEQGSPRVSRNKSSGFSSTSRPLRPALTWIVLKDTALVSSTVFKDFF
jgi:hypothetical protein